MKRTGYSLKLMDVICVTNRLLQLPLQQQHASYKNDHFSSHFFHLHQIYCCLLTLQTAYTGTDLLYPQFTFSTHFC